MIKNTKPSYEHTTDEMVYHSLQPDILCMNLLAAHILNRPEKKHFKNIILPKNCILGILLSLTFK